MGVGLGLAVARGFTEIIGGELDIEDTPGGGCTVVIRLPAPDAAEPELVADERPALLPEDAA